MGVIKIDDIRDQVEELVSRAEAGETILIEKDGKPIARLIGVDPPKEKSEAQEFSWQALKQFTDSLPPARESAVDLIRRMRDESY